MEREFTLSAAALSRRGRAGSLLLGRGPPVGHYCNWAWSAAVCMKLLPWALTASCLVGSEAAVS